MKSDDDDDLHPKRPPKPPPSSGPPKATLPRTERKHDLPPADPVIALLIVGRNIELPMPAEVESFKLGRRDCALLVESEHVSNTHANLVRKGNMLLVTDLRSTEGTFLNNRREVAFEIVAGDSIRVGDVTLLAVDRPMWHLRPHLLWHLGTRAYGTVDHTLEQLGRDEPVLLYTPAYGEPRDLAEQIHRGSPRRHKPFVVVGPEVMRHDAAAAALDHATGGTIYIDLDRVRKPTGNFVDKLFDSASSCRPIFATSRRGRAYTALDDHFAGLSPVTIPAVSGRNDVPKLFDTLFKEASSSARMADLGDKLRGLKKKWKGFGEVREHAAWLRVFLETGRMSRETARQTGIPHGTIQSRLKALGLNGADIDSEQRPTKGERTPPVKG